MIVLDASAAVDIVCRTEVGEAFRELALSGEAMIAPYLFVSEVSNALAKYARAGIMSAETAVAKAQEAHGLVDEFVPDHELMPEAMLEALCANQLVYDMLYLVLAQRRKATLFTCDRKLVAMCELRGVDCVHVIDL